MDLGQAFSGIKVLAVARIVAAPFAAYQLAMHGADVIQIENPEAPDSARTSGNLSTPFHDAKMAHNFLAYNANKRSMTLAINTAAGQQVFRKMAASADVVIENLRGGTMAPTARLRGPQEDQLLASFSCSSRVTGRRVPKSDPAIDGVIQAVSGMMSITAPPERDRSRPARRSSDYTTAMLLRSGSRSLSFSAQRIGEGQRSTSQCSDRDDDDGRRSVLRAITATKPAALGNASARAATSATRTAARRPLSFAVPSRFRRREKFWKAIDGMDIPRSALCQRCRRG